MSDASRSVASALGVPEDTVESRVAPDELAALARALVPAPRGVAVRALRRFAGTLLPRAPQVFRRAVTGIAKRLREPLLPARPRVEDLPLVALARRLGSRAEPRVELSHDVDWRSCYACVERVAELERERGVRSTFLFLANDAYRVDRGLVRALASEGFGIGVHGWTHDVALGLRTEARIRDQLSRAVEAVGGAARAFRAPGLSATPALLAIADELGFEVDGSLTATGTGTVFPYRIPGLRLREHPLSLQDDQLFRDRALSDDAALQAARAALDETLAVGGSFVLNAHPTLVVEHLSFYERFVDLARERAPVVAFGTAPAPARATVREGAL